MNATTRDTALLTRPAMRFILRHRRGTLAALDIETGNTVTAPIEYEVDQYGQLIGHIAAGDELLDVIAAEAAVSLTVDAADPDELTADTDETGMPSEYSIDHVCALVNANIIERHEPQAGQQNRPVTILRLDIHDIEVDIRQVAV